MTDQSLANWIVAISTIAALLLAVWQLRQNSTLASQSSAKERWMEYLRLGLDNPELGETRIALKFLGIDDVAKLVSGDTIESQRYLWFLTVMLDACENLLLHPNERWERTIKENIGYHLPAIRQIWPTERRHYSDNFGRLVDDVIDDSVL